MSITDIDVAEKQAQKELLDLIKEKGTLGITAYDIFQFTTKWKGAGYRRLGKFYATLAGLAPTHGENGKPKSE
jgi:hypothetical protein